VGEALAAHVLVEQREAVEVQRLVVVVRRGVEQLERSLERVDQVLADRLQLGQRDACVTCASSKQWSASARMEASRVCVGSQRAPRWRCMLRAIQRSWNQPMCPSSHSGGLRSSLCGTFSDVASSACS
jgi:hypothetical protein